MANTNTRSTEVSSYAKKNFILIILAVIVNIIIIWLVFSWVIQNLLTSLLYIKLFDYYTTYIVILWLFNTYVAFQYVNNVEKKISLEKLDEAEALWLDLGMIVYKIKGKDITLKDFIVLKDVDWCTFSSKDIVKDIDEKTRDFIYSSWTEYGEKMKNIDYIPNLLVVLFIIAGLVSLLFGRISVNNFVSKYENKYKRIEYEIKDKEEKKYVRETTISKLEDLKNKYVNEFGTGSDVVKQIDEDIAKLKVE